MGSNHLHKSRQRAKAGHAKIASMVPLASLLKLEKENDKLETPAIQYGQAFQAKKGEDFILVKLDCQRIPGDGSSTFAAFGVLDGHNGASAAIYAKENLLQDVLSAISPTLCRDEWLAALPRALVAGFVKTDKDFQQKGQTSGTTATFVVIDRWTVTVASVGDSRCILDPQGCDISTLTVDHRFDDNEEERDRVTRSGGEVGRLSIAGGAEIGPLRCWPGGLCLSRSIGDVDVGEYIVPIPHVKQIKLSKAGGRLIMASDGVWDALSCEKAASCCRGLSAEVAARQVVKESLRVRGLRDDTTCLVVDLLPPDNYFPLSLPPPKKQGKVKSWLFGWRSKESTAIVANKLGDMGIVEELFEEGSAMLADRLGSDATTSLFNCAICQIHITLSEGISVHAGSFFSMTNRTLEGPFLCTSCKAKKDAMEGKQPLRGY
ncbi:hypothetical protein GOP47_0008624 [Adiantum capillus-veneris]|uniref:protein-serine/threonine phosphatase n=1 Tax=Adiantum capillus-veneris TaxID=13818 RepID=A0A9D4UZ17_ADICA|nr:hypothetical protein GOP47_0008624 [Adiantum capillus-veneris]